MRPGLLAFALLSPAAAACAAPAAPAPSLSVSVPRAKSEPEPSPLAARSEALPKPAICAKPGISLEPPSIDVDAACWPSCSLDIAQVVLRIVNCSERRVVFESYAVASENAAGFRVDAPRDEVIAPGTMSAPIVAALGRTGHGHVIVHVVGAREVDELDTKVLLPVTVRDSRKDAAISACAARGDFWGPRGILGTEDCWPVMRDDGKECHDARDCEGQCVMVSELVVSPAMKRVEGRCSRFKAVFGCGTRIGQTTHGLMPRNRSFPSVCVD